MTTQLAHGFLIQTYLISSTNIIKALFYAKNRPSHTLKCYSKKFHQTIQNPATPYNQLTPVT